MAKRAASTTEASPPDSRGCVGGTKHDYQPMSEPFFKRITYGKTAEFDRDVTYRTFFCAACSTSIEVVIQNLHPNEQLRGQ